MQANIFREAGEVDVNQVCAGNTNIDKHKAQFPVLESGNYKQGWRIRKKELENKCVWYLEPVHRGKKVVQERECSPGKPSLACQAGSQIRRV